MPPFCGASTNRIGPRIHVTVKWRRSVEGLVLHRTRRLDPDEVTTKNGIPVTTVAAHVRRPDRLHSTRTAYFAQ